MDNKLVTKLDSLHSLLRELDSVIVAFSAGVDSTLLVRVAHEVLGDRVLAVAGLSDSFPHQEAEEARRLVAEIGVRYEEITTGEMDDDAYLQNAPDRCFYCKSDLFGRLVTLARERGYKAVADGCNADDASDYRPGMRAGRQLGVRSPLREAGLTKQDVRQLSLNYGLPTWDKPAMACLASRIPYGERITTERLRRVNEAECFLRQLGFTQVRVRSSDDVARIEVQSDRVAELAGDEVRTAVVERLKEIGFRYITVDLQGYRSGSLNEVLSDGSEAGK